MYLRGTIERMGTGTEDMTNICIERGLPKPFFQQQLDFRVVLYRNTLETQTDLKTDLETDLKLDETDREILKVMIRDNTVTLVQIAKKIGKGISATKDRIAKLKQQGLVQRIGATKGGYWKVII